MYQRIYVFEESDIFDAKLCCFVNESRISDAPNHRKQNIVIIYKGSLIDFFGIRSTDIFYLIEVNRTVG